MRGTSASFRRRLLSWYDRQQRNLPWRVPEPDPYHVLVSEVMLQQTQVGTVIPYFKRFIRRFRTFHELARAREQDVLRIWQGLGYYSRARSLHAAAKMIVREFGGSLPDDPSELMKLPGVGRYTAGAVTSIAFGRRSPAVDGNVSRVLCRLDAIDQPPDAPAVREMLWQRAEQLLPSTRTGDFNSALMELGATTCRPRSPGCGDCPVQSHCSARAAGVQHRIPPPRRRQPVPVERRWTFCISCRGRWLIEQRPSHGRWGGMWQFVTVNSIDGIDPLQAVHPVIPGITTVPEALGEFSHRLTHRLYRFEVFHCACQSAGEIASANGGTRRWTRLSELARFPLPRPQMKIAEMLRRR